MSSFSPNSQVFSLIGALILTAAAGRPAAAQPAAVAIVFGHSDFPSELAVVAICPAAPLAPTRLPASL